MIEEETPSPQPVSISARTALRLQRLDQALDLLRNNPVERWEPVPRDLSPLAQDPTPHTEAATTRRPGQGEWTAPPSTAPTHQEGEPGPLNREAALAILGMKNIQLWDPAEELLSPTLLVGLATPPSAPPPPATATERQHCSLEGGMAYQLYPAATVQPAPASTPPLARVTERQHGGPEEEEVDQLLRELAASPEGVLVPPPTTLQSSINARPFVPAHPGHRRGPSDSTRCCGP